jgi:hypothetical protein
MASDYRGVFLIGDKAANLITHVQVEDPGGNLGLPLPFHEYKVLKVEPNYATLPWQEDIEPRAAAPKV